MSVPNIEVLIRISSDSTEQRTLAPERLRVALPIIEMLESELQRPIEGVSEEPKL